ncbi:hypothetical protein [Gordonia westfalica]|uniref:Uncharacterized protein n=1 Tax=Gordonia westfalica TaxID=158898 RepID=A0A1H2DQ99_9ACTN|nr:hypothetical protein [Gordonia westfalica]SDT85029.1 hypothetical protein SAMN04488548_11418 [Gordonia westfalica]SDT85185.1 hypothetical protein SAMN04488548_11617 [Gordonia westfalica]
MKEALILKARDRLDVVDTGLSAIISKALRIEGFETEETISLSWEPPDHVSLSEKYDAAVKAKGAGSHGSRLPATFLATRRSRSSRMP